MPDDEQKIAQPGDDAKIIRPQKIYLKDASFEAPNSPAVFTLKWAPKLSLEINHTTAALEQDLHEVVLTLTATVTVEDKTAFLVEIHQAGIFTLKGHDPEALQRLQSVYCLRTLYPYACAALSGLVTKGGFPDLPLAPMHFGALYAKKLQEAAAEQGS